jgi:hypothetical protein
MESFWFLLLFTYENFIRETSHYPPPFPPTPSCRPLISAPFFVLVEKKARGLEWGGEKGTRKEEKNKIRFQFIIDYIKSHAKNVTINGVIELM